MVAWLHLGIVFAAGAFALGAAVQLALMLTATRRLVRLHLRFEPRVMRDIVGRSWPIGVSIFFNLLYLKGDIVFMWLFGRSETEIGIYGSAYKVVDVITTVPTMFMGLLLPVLALAWTTKRYDVVTTKLQEAFNVLMLLAVPFAAGTMLVGEPLMALVKPDLVEAGTVLRILGPTGAAVFLGALYGHAVVAINKQRHMTLGYVAVAIIAIAGYVLFIPTYGMYGAAWTSLVAELLIAAIAFIVVARTTGHDPRLRMALTSLAATGVMSAVIVVLALPVLAEIALGVMTYAIALGAFGGPSPRAVLRLFVSDRPPIIVGGTAS